MWQLERPGLGSGPPQLLLLVYTFLCALGAFDLPLGVLNVRAAHVGNMADYTCFYAEPLVDVIQGFDLMQDANCLFVTDYFTRTPRKLNAFNSFASVELFHFNVPDDTMMAVWNLITFKEQGGTFGDSCPDRNVTVYFRSGAPPVINPLYTHFPRDTIVPGSFAVTLTWTLPNRTTGAFNVTSPLPGDWFLAAHLPKDEGKISVKGLYEECQYLFQPQLIVQRLIGISVLYPGYFINQMIPVHNRSTLYK
ncbi:post-GPI attachment to proteins factor 6-like [Diretmus argenteus]